MISGMVTQIRRGARVHLYITQWRENAGLTLEQLGGRLGVGKNTVWRWETEQDRLSPSKIAAIADALGIDSTDLYFLPGTRQVDPLIADEDDETRQNVFELVERWLRKA